MAEQLNEAVHQRALLALEWDDTTVRLRVRDNGAKQTRLIDPVGLALNYRVEDGDRRWCVGHHAQGTGYVDCARIVEDRGRTCSRCQAAEAIFASQLHHAHTQPKRSVESSMGQHLQQPNVLYLAAFRDGSIKVGTSTGTRSEKRLREQGAWMARKVAVAADGYAVRELEDLVTRDLGVSQAVLGARKVAGLAEPVADASLSDTLDALATSVRLLIDEMADERLQPTSVVWANPATAESIWRGARRYPLRLIRGSHDLEIIAVVGRSAAVRRPSRGNGGPADSEADDVFVVDLGTLFGFELTLGDFSSDEIVIQDSLF